MTLEWVAVVLLVPIVIVPFVLLFGFSGCQLVFGLKHFPHVATITSADPLDVARIRLVWTFSGAAGTQFEVRRTLAGETIPTKLPRLTETTFEDTGLAEGSTYLYQVASFEPDSDEEGVSDTVTASTFGKCFEAVLDGERTRDRRTIVQRIEPARLAKSGTRVLVTIQRPAGGDLVINAATISQAADAAYAPAADMTPLLAAPLLISADAANGPHALDIVNYALDHTQALLLAFDIQTPGNVREHSPIPSTDATAFVAPIGVLEATLPARSAGYNVEARIYLVQRIDVV